MALFERNLPNWERGLRAAAGLGVIVFVVAAGWTGWWLLGGLATGAVMFWMAGFGFCPACALVGRRLPRSN